MTVTCLRIGGGAILRDKGGVTGTATAASVWNIGIVGAAVGMGGYHIAVALSLVNFLTLRFLKPRREPRSIQINESDSEG